MATPRTPGISVLAIAGIRRRTAGSAPPLPPHRRADRAGFVRAVPAYGLRSLQRYKRDCVLTGLTLGLPIERRRLGLLAMTLV